MQPTSILLIDQQAAGHHTVAPWLRAHGYAVEIVRSAGAATAALASRSPDLIAIDLDVPGVDGPELFKRVREASKVPVVIVSRQRGEADKVTMLDLGADDYITKPVGFAELVARIRAVLRRSVHKAPATGRVVVGDLTLDYDRRRVFRGEEAIRLTPKEFELFSLFVRNPDRVLTHGAILTAIWGSNASSQPEHLWVLVAQLRKKIEPDPTHPRYLVSEPWVGYRLAPTSPSPS